MQYFRRKAIIVLVEPRRDDRPRNMLISAISYFNQDLGHFICPRRDSRPFWNRVFSRKRRVSAGRTLRPSNVGEYITVSLPRSRIDQVGESGRKSVVAVVERLVLRGHETRQFEER